MIQHGSSANAMMWEGVLTIPPLCLGGHLSAAIARLSVDNEDPSNHTLLTHRLLLVTLPASGMLLGALHVSFVYTHPEPSYAIVSMR